MPLPPNLYIQQQTTRSESVSIKLICHLSATYWVANVCCGNNVGVKEDGKEFNDSVEVEEHDDFFPTCTSIQEISMHALFSLLTNRRVFASYVENHDCSHYNGDDVYEACRYVTIRKRVAQRKTL